jgi:hypothetical protein
MSDRVRKAVGTAVVSGALIVAGARRDASPARAQAAGGESGVTVSVAPAPQTTATVNPAFLRQQPSGVPFSTSSIALVAVIAIVVVAAILNVRGKKSP